MANLIIYDHDSISHNYYFFKLIFIYDSIKFHIIIIIADLTFYLNEYHSGICTIFLQFSYLGIFIHSFKMTYQSIILLAEQFEFNFSTLLCKLLCLHHQ